ncbi:MAG: ABC transporter ATP-binding protein [Actinomycetota bacterium]|nr:ABC transporter ATP-binding protein [Actinomycetota bacterium]
MDQVRGSNPAAVASELTVLVEVAHLTKIYRNGVTANDDISLGIDAGEVFGLLGPNGAGKTTLVGQVLGSIVPTSGAIRLAEQDVVRNPAVARRICSYQPQSSAPTDGMTPLEAIQLIGEIRGGKPDAVRARAKELIELLELGEWATKVMQLSGGVARLVTFCMAIVVPGRLVVLDEPTNDIDPLRRKLLWQLVRAAADDGSAVLLVTHNVLEAERCVDRLAIIDHARVIGTGTPAAMKSGFHGELRLEITLEPDTDLSITPDFIRHTTRQGRRVFADIDVRHLQDAITWATSLREGNIAEEFSIGPATLEDVYVRQVAQPNDIDRREEAPVP